MTVGGGGGGGVLCLAVLLAGGGFNGKQAQLLVRGRAFGVCAVRGRWCSKGSKRKCLSQPVSARHQIAETSCLRHQGILHFHMLVVKIVCHVQLNYTMLCNVRLLSTE
jgi:hypothetical protein